MGAMVYFMLKFCIPPVKLFYVLICLAANIQLDLVSIPWSVSVSKNHGHSWMTSRSLLAVAESPLLYGSLHGSKDLAKVHVCCYSDFTYTFVQI